MNLAVVTGRLSRPAETRELPSGDLLVDLQVSVEGDGNRPTESVPVVWPQSPSRGARSGAPPRGAELDTGDEVLVVGRVRRRFFRAGGATASRTEVVAEHVVRPSQAKLAQRVLTEALARLEDVRSG